MSQIKNLSIPRKKTIFIGIGTNKGNREKNILLTLKLLKRKNTITGIKISQFLKNPPQEGIKSGYFLNGALKAKTLLTPTDLLKKLKSIERRLGRIENKNHKYKRNKSRTIDLDLLFYSNEIIRTNELIIPHPMIHKRYFVLIPLLEIGKNFRHPVFRKTISELYTKLMNKHIKALA